MFKNIDRTKSSKQLGWIGSDFVWFARKFNWYYLDVDNIFSVDHSTFTNTKKK